MQSLKRLGTVVVVSLHAFQWFTYSCLWPFRIESELALCDQPNWRMCWCKARKPEALALLPGFLRSLTVADTSCHILMPFKQPFYDAHVEGKLGPWV